MKICYDSLEGIKLTSNGVFLKKGRTIYVEMDSCKKCGDPYLTLKHRMSQFCSQSCAYTGRVYSAEHNKKLSDSKKGVPTKHGAYILGLAAYETYADRLWCDKTGYKYIKDSKILTVSCVNCNKMFIPKASNVIHRIRYLEGKETCESRFYCSDECRAICPIFWQHKYPKGHESFFEYTRNEYEVWRKEVLKNANYKCEYCGEEATDAHHIKPKKLEPFFALGPDYGVACCKKCHYKYGHSAECNTAVIANTLCV